MLGKLVCKLSGFVKPEETKIGLSVVQKFKTDLARMPKTDVFIYNPIKKNYGQKFAELEKRLEIFAGKEEILKHVNNDNIDTVLNLSQIQQSDGYFAYKALLNELVPKLTTQNQDVIAKLANMKDVDGNVIYRLQLETMTSIITDKNKAHIIKIAETKNPQGEYVYGYFDLPDALQIKDAINHKMIGISDSKILDYLVKKNLPNAELSQLEEVNEVLDVHHTFNNKYSYIGKWLKRGEWIKSPANQEYYQYIKQNPNAFPGGKRELLSQFNGSTEACDFMDASRTDRLKTFCKEKPNHEFSNYFYNEYYLKSDLVRGNLKEKCSEINKKFGVKIFLSNNHPQNEFILNYIEKELAELEKASDGQAKKPDILDLSTIKKRYIDDKAAYGNGKSGGFCNENEIGVPGSAFSNVTYALRHELTHLNDLKQGFHIPEKYDLNEIMPRKEILDNDLDIISVPDIERCKYKQEFYNAGISREHVPYAYNNSEEFIAVASEGDMSKYSPEFKQVLIDFGMPKWMFKMRPKDEIIKEAIVETI